MEGEVWEEVVFDDGKGTLDLELDNAVTVKRVCECVKCGGKLDLSSALFGSGLEKDGRTVAAELVRRGGVGAGRWGL